MRRLPCVPLAALVLTVASACKSHRPPAPSTPDSTAAAPPTASVSVAHPLDPHALSDAELRYGVSPTPNAAVTYQPNVVLMTHGADAIKSVSPDGLTWTFDATSPEAAQIDTGKILFATSRAVGKVLAVQHSGSTLSVVLGPVELTDVIKEADLSYDQPVDLQSMVAYSAPNYPGASNDMDKLTAFALPPDGETPVSFASDRRQRPPDLTFADAMAFRAMQIPSAPAAPSIGPPSQTDLGDFHAIPFCCGGIGIKILHNGDDMNLLAYAVLHLTNPSLKFDLKIHGGAVQTAKIVLNGAAGLTVHIESATAKGVDGNINKQFFVPVDLSIPIGGMGVPFAVTLHQQLIIRTAFTAKNSTLTTTGDYSFSGQIYMGLDNGNWGVGAPTALHINSSLGQSLDGLSLGVTGIVFGMEGRIIVGIGAFGFVTGPYLGYAAIVGLTRGSDQAKMLVGVTCRGSVLDLTMNVGVGYQMPQPVTKGINAVLKALNLAPIQGSGGLKHNEPLLHTASDNPKGCAYGK
jgi:hypothetical protein